MAGPWTRELEVRTCLLSAEVSLVGSVATIVLAVALPDVRNAPSIFTGKLRCSTSHIAALELVRVIAAVVFMIAAEVQRNTATRFALELVGAAGWF